MNEPIKSTEETTTQTQAGKEPGRCGSHRHRGRFVGRVLAMFMAVGLGFFAGNSYSGGHDMCHRGPAAFMQGEPIDAERMGKFADKRMQRMLKSVDATDAQKEKASAIVKASLEQGAPLAESMRDNHLQMRKLMSATTIDKAAIESMRAEHIQLMDEASKQMTSTMLAVAAVLTPEQRAKLAEKMEKRRGRK